LILPETLFAPARNVIGSGGIDPVVNNGAAMTEAQLMTELAESCRRLACYQRNPNVLDMLHDLEEDFIQAAAKRETETSGGAQTHIRGCSNKRTAKGEFLFSP
jgi:hypothetical protein